MKESGEAMEGYGNGDEVVGEVHKEVDGGPEVEGIIGRGRALALNKHDNTHIKPAVFLVAPTHVVAVQHSLHSTTPATSTMWSSRSARWRRGTRQLSALTS